MFKKILIANRGEIAVRILRACRALNVRSLALFQAADRGSLHVRLADECVQLDAPAGFTDQDAILRIAVEKGADAIHTGYGFLAEREDFVRKCAAAGIAFIGPPADAIERARQKVDALRRAAEAGYPVPPHSGVIAGDDLQARSIEAELLGYPLVVKSSRGGRGRGERLVWSPERLERLARAAQTEAQAVYDDRFIYLEKVLLPAHQIGVQIVADRFGNRIHLGERDGSMRYGNQKIVEETPAPCLTPAQRAELCQAALDLAALFEIENVVTVEFLVDSAGQFFFTEIKPRIQIEHPLSEMVSGVDLVAMQIRLAAGEALDLRQDQVRLDGHAMQCRISAEDPWRQFLPRPGFLNRVRLPGGPGVRVDTYVYSGCYIPAEYDPLIVKVAASGASRVDCLARLRQALRETQLTGAPTNLPLVQRIIDHPDFVDGVYTTDFLPSPFEEDPVVQELGLRDLAAIAALVYLRKQQVRPPALPERLIRGWHRDSRRLPS
jgi:acetyl/propionyl-CoA carboxylase alpha subunit